MSFSLSVPIIDPDTGFDGVGDGSWNEWDMLDGDRPFSLSMPDVIIDKTSSPTASPIDAHSGEDGIGDWWWLDGESMPYGDRSMSLSISMPLVDPIFDDGFNGIGNEWWLDGESMPYGDRSMSLSLSLSMPEFIIDTDDTPESFSNDVSNDVEEFQFSWAE